MTGMEAYGVCVIGASGFIGTNLIRTLGERSIATEAVGRSNRHNILAPSIKWHNINFSDKSALRDVVRKSGTVIHLVTTSLPTDGMRSVKNDILTNIIPSLDLFEMCVDSGVKKVIFLSSGGTIYGEPSSVPIAEDVCENPQNGYGVTKMILERYLSLYSRYSDLDYVVLRIANPYGPYQTSQSGQGVVASFLERARNNLPLEVWGDGSAIRDFLYVEDVVAAIIAAINYRGDKRIFNIGSGSGTAISELIHVISALYGRDLRVEYKNRAAFGVKSNVLDISLANTELGWRPKTNLADGLARTIDWLDKSATFN